MPDLSVFLHIHGAVMSGWMVLFFAQTALVSLDRVAAHRALGTFGAVYAAHPEGSQGRVREASIAILKH